MKTLLQQKRSRRTGILIGAGTIIAAAVIAIAVYLGTYYHASAEAMAVLTDSEEAVTIEEFPGQRIAFVPDAPIAGLIFYPGGKVQYEAYAPLLEECASRGILCVLVHMPGNLAVLDRDAADGVMELYPEVADWYIGGHSLGGAMAASYAAKHAGELDGLILLAAYSTEDLRGSGLRVLTAYGTEDGVLNREKYAEALANLPEGYTEIIIDGGCHGYFGSYGAQSGDGVPTISAGEQIGQTVDAIAAMVISG